MTKKDFKLDIATHDLVFELRDLALLEGIDYYRQKLSIVLQFFFGEWFLDTTLGIKFFEEILIKNYNKTLVDNLIKTAILNEDGFIKIVEYESTFNRFSRSFTITGVVLTTAGVLELDDSFNIGTGV